MRTMRWITWCAAAAIGWSCAGSPSRVPVSADPAALASLAGEWTGGYESPALGRGGSIVFRLAAGRDTAEGDVVMVPHGAQGPLPPAPGGNPGEVVRASMTPQVLTIRFVRVQGDVVRGALDPYRDPACGCTVFTTFTGKLAGNRLRGTFVTHGEPTGVAVTGTWSVERKVP